MAKRFIVLAVSAVLACSLCLSGCAAPQPTEVKGRSGVQAESSSSGASTGAVSSSDASQSSQEVDMDDSQAPMIASITMNGRTFVLDMADNDTAAAFAALLPLQLQMAELNGNEKYVYLNESLPANATNPGTIEAGDVMLFGSNCLVVFYESHSTQYSYTRIGKIADVEGLKESVGSGSVEATFESA